MTAAPSILLDFLRTDVRNNRKQCDALLAQIADVQAGRREGFESSGNLYIVQISRDAAIIENLFDDSQVLTLSPEELADALTGWRRHLDDPMT